MNNDNTNQLHQVQDANQKQSELLEDAKTAGFHTADGGVRVCPSQYESINNVNILPRIEKLTQLQAARAKLTTQDEVSEPIYFYRNRESVIGDEIVYTGWYQCNKDWYESCQQPHHGDYYQVKLMYAAPTTTPQEAISPAIAEYIKKLESLVKNELDYSLYAREVLASKPTGLE